jgi:hypothetical protein
MNTANKIDYVYILGASHSGSTLLAMLLNAHPDITTIGETSPGKMGDINKYRCSCRKIIKECHFWENVVTEMRKKHPEFDFGHFGTKFECVSRPIINRLLLFEHRGILLEFLRDAMLGLSPHWRQYKQDITARCCDLVTTVLAQSGGRIFVDSSKLAHRLKFLLCISKFNVKVIHLVRDGRAVALTYMNQDEFGDSKDTSLRRGGMGMKAEATVASLPMEKAADEWRRCLSSAEHVLAGLDKSQYIGLHYEDLCRDPEVALERLFIFLSLDPDKRVKDFRSIEQHVIGNGMRLDTTAQVVLDERWKTVLTKEDLKTFDRIAGTMNRRYGYE